MTFWAAVKTCYSKYATFGGRASRPEFWYFILFDVLAGIVASILDLALFNVAPAEGFGPLYAIFAIGSIVPGLAVGCRRLHDIDRSGWWQLTAFIPDAILVSTASWPRILVRSVKLRRQEVQPCPGLR